MRASRILSSSPTNIAQITVEMAKTQGGRCLAAGIESGSMPHRPVEGRKLPTSLARTATIRTKPPKTTTPSGRERRRFAPKRRQGREAAENNDAVGPRTPTIRAKTSTRPRSHRKQRRRRAENADDSRHNADKAAKPPKTTTPSGRERRRFAPNRRQSRRGPNATRQRWIADP